MKFQRVYIAIDMKSFYASVECVARGYDPLKANLLVADASRTEPLGECHVHKIRFREGSS